MQHLCRHSHIAAGTAEVCRPQQDAEGTPGCHTRDVHFPTIATIHSHNPSGIIRFSVGRCHTRWHAASAGLAPTWRSFKQSMPCFPAQPFSGLHCREICNLRVFLVWMVAARMMHQMMSIRCNAAGCKPAAAAAASRPASCRHTALSCLASKTTSSRGSPAATTSSSSRSAGQQASQEAPRKSIQVLFRCLHRAYSSGWPYPHKSPSNRTCSATPVSSVLCRTMPGPCSSGWKVLCTISHQSKKVRRQKPWPCPCLAPATSLAQSAPAPAH